MQATGNVSTDGVPVYADARGMLRAEIADGVGRPIDPALGAEHTRRDGEDSQGPDELVL
ncbi:DUF6296 family protein [Streptomyces sp. NPDC003480]